MTNRINDYDEREVAQAIVDLTMPPLKEPTDLSIWQFIEEVQRQRGVKLSYRQAEYRLSALEEQGKVEKVQRWDPVNNREITCFRLTEEAVDV